jgi:hypothetical protein
MILLRQSTTSQEIPLGIFVDSTDGNTEESGLTIANTDIKIWKTGATTLANKNSGGGTYISNGIYYAVLDDTDTNTLGSLVIFVHVAGALAVRLECLVLTSAVYDSMIAGSDNLQVDMTQILGTAVSSPATAGILDVNLKNIANAAVATGSAQLGVNVVSQANIDFGALQKSSLNSATPASVTGAVGSVTSDVGITQAAADKVWNSTASLNATLVTNLKNAIWNALLTGLTTASSIGKKLADWVLGTDNKIMISTDAQGAVVIPTVSTVTGGATAAAISALNNLSSAQVNAEVVDALNTDTYAEPAQGAPAATASLAAKIGFLYKAWRNRKTQTASLLSIYNDNTSTVDHKAVVSDNGTTFDVGEIGSGP